MFLYDFSNFNPVPADFWRQQKKEISLLPTVKIVQKECGKMNNDRRTRHGFSYDTLSFFMLPWLISCRSAYNVHTNLRMKDDAGAVFFLRFQMNAAFLDSMKVKKKDGRTQRLLSWKWMRNSFKSVLSCHRRFFSFRSNYSVSVNIVFASSTHFLHWNQHEQKKMFNEIQSVISRFHPSSKTDWNFDWQCQREYARGNIKSIDTIISNWIAKTLLN